MDVRNLASRQLELSVRRLAEETGMARETVQKRISEFRVQPCGSRNGHPVYRLRDVCPALFGSPEFTEGGPVDPAKLKPQDRRAWFQSENERLKFEQETGQLILAAEVQSEMGTLAKIVVRALETLPDTVERDLRCGPEVVEYLQRKVRELRLELADRVVSEEGEDVRERA